MTPSEVKAARLAMGMTQAQLATALELSADGKRTIRHWETDGGKYRITGPARVAIRLLMERPQRLSEIAPNTANGE